LRREKKWLDDGYARILKEVKKSIKQDKTRYSDNFSQAGKADGKSYRKEVYDITRRVAGSQR